MTEPTLKESLNVAAAAHPLAVEWTETRDGGWLNGVEQYLTSIEQIGDRMAQAITRQQGEIARLTKLVAFDEAIATFYTAIIEGVEPVDSMDGSQNWWMFADKARSFAVARFKEFRTRAQAAEARAAAMQVVVDAGDELYSAVANLLDHDPSKGTKFLFEAREAYAVASNNLVRATRQPKESENG